MPADARASPRPGPGRLASGSLRRRNPWEDLLCRFSDLYGDCCTEQVADEIADDARWISEPRIGRLPAAPSMTIGMATPR